VLSYSPNLDDPQSPPDFSRRKPLDQRVGKRLETLEGGFPGRPQNGDSFIFQGLEKQRVAKLKVQRDPRPLVKFIVTVVDPQLGETVLDPAAGTGGFLVEAFEHLRTQARKSEEGTQLQRGTLFGIEPKPLPYLLCQMNLLLHGLEYPSIDPENALRFPLREIGDRDRVDVIMTNPPFGGEEERGVLSNFP
jgi:hypothetical protein